MLIVLAVILLDQITKIWTVGASDGRNPTLITVVIQDYFHIVHYRNKGAAWGMFSNSTYILAIISLLAFIYFIFDFPSFTENIPFRKFVWALLIGGVFGNFIDRAFRPEGVVDMLEVYIPIPSFMQAFVEKYVSLTHYGAYQFPAFNVADSGICVGVFLYFFHVMFFSRKENKAEEAKAGAISADEDKKEEKQA